MVNWFTKEKIVHEMNTEIKKENLDIPAFSEESDTQKMEKAFPILLGRTLHYDGCGFSKGHKVETLSTEEKTKELYLVLGM